MSQASQRLPQFPPMSVQFSSADNKPLGIILMLAGALTLVITDVAGKWVVQNYHVAQLNFVRGIFATLILAPIVLREGGLSSLRTARPAAHFARSIVLVAIAYAWFFSLKFMPLADAGAIILCAPLFITALSAVALKEHVGPWRWGAVVVGFGGMLFIIQPGTDLFQPIAILPALGALGYAIYMVSNRAMRMTESVSAITLYPQIAVCAVSAAIAPFVWTPMTWSAFALMVLTGVAAGVGHLLLTYAFRLAPSSVLAPLDYTGLIWSVVFGYFVFGDWPVFVTWIGMALIVSAGLFMVFRETRAAAEPNQPAA
ncbi:MAG: DMT family transporter [Rhodobacteraceae bacterium]|nr:DMT family transporter [Paracoccaceae bacterium]